MPNRCLIIADIHLGVDDAAKLRLFQKFCDTQAGAADRLFILGDLFDLWLGDDISLPMHETAIKTLHTLSRTSEIFIQRGNRDFLLGADFAAASGASIIGAPYLLKIEKRQYLLTHGDELCTDDLGYQRLRKILRNQIVRFFLLNLPAKFRRALGQNLRRKSVRSKRKKSARMMDVNLETADALMKNYPETDLIHGHTHRQNTHQYPNYRRYVLGDWSAEVGNAIEISDDVHRIRIE